MFAPIGPRPSSSNVTRLRLVLPWVLVLLVRTLGAQSSQTPFYMELPPNVLPYAVDASGWVSVGLRYNSTTGQYWMPATGTVDIGGLAGFAVSDDGKTIVGNALDSQGRENAAIWTGGKTWRLLGSFTADAQSCDRSYSSSYGATGDGRVVVGLAWDTCKIARAFRWEERTGVVSLGSLSGESTRANNISADGQVIVGWEQHATGFRQAAKWVNGSEQLIKNANGGFIGEAYGTNRDGSIIVGSNCDPESTSRVPTGWTWTAGRGVQCLPVERPNWVAPNFYQVIPRVVSDDGRVIAGSYSFGLESQSLIWLDGQPTFLRDYLRDNGVAEAFRDWVHTGFVTDMTPDGRTLVGYGAGPTTFQGFLVVLPDRGKR